MKRDSRVTWTLSACTALALFGDATMYAVLPSEYAALSIGAAAVGWMLSVNRLVRLPLNFASGWLGDRAGPKVPYVCGILLGVISTAGYGLVQGFWPLLTLRALWGVAWALIVVSAYGMILDVSSPATRARLTGTYAPFSFFGGALGAMLGGYLVDSAGFRTAMQAMGGCTALGFLGALSLPRTRSAPAREVGHPGIGQMSPPAVWAWCRRVWDDMLRLDRRLFLILLLNFAHRFFFAGVLYATIGRFLLDVFGDAISLNSRAVGVASLAGMIIFVRNLVTILVGPALGHVSDRRQDRTSLLVVGEAVGAAGLGFFALGRSLTGVVVGVLLTAVAYGIIPPLLMAWLGDITPSSRRGAAVGGYQTMGDLGSGLAPVLAYALLEVLDIRTVYLSSAVCLLLAVPLIVWSRSRRARPTLSQATEDPE